MTRKSLASAAAQRGMLYGAAASTADLDDEILRRSLVRECGAITPEYEMKWDIIEPAPGELNFAAADRLFEFAETYKIALRGHTPWWHLSMPAWLDQLDDAAFGEAALSHLGIVVERYAGRLHSLDVINEPLEPADGRPDGLRQSRFLKVFGCNYIALAFSIAARANTDTILTINETGLESNSKSSASKRCEMLKLLNSQLSIGAPIGALGLQAHLSIHDAPAFNLDFRRFLREVDALGLSVAITELDVDCNQSGLGVGECDRSVARIYREIVETVAEESRLTAVFTWGVSDRKSWLNKRPGSSPNRGLPLDANGRRKAAWRSLADAMSQVV